MAPFLISEYAIIENYEPIDKETMIRYFETIDLKYDWSTGEVIVPTWRQDILCHADLDEEVARFFGYANIPVTLPKGSGKGSIPLDRRLNDIARDVAEQYGFSEAMTYSFESPKVFDKLLLAADVSEGSSQGRS